MGKADLDRVLFGWTGHATWLLLSEHMSRSFAIGDEVRDDFCVLVRCVFDWRAYCRSIAEEESYKRWAGKG